DPSRAPNLARLAAGGRAFDQAFAAAPDSGGARAAVVGSGAQSLAALFRARGFAVAASGDPAGLGADAATLDAVLPPGTEAGGALDRWLRGQAGRFLLLTSLGQAGAPGVPATEAGSFAPPLPRIATDDLDPLARPGGTVRPAAWSEPARERALADGLERAMVADAALGGLVSLVDRAARGTAIVVVGDPPSDHGAHGVVRRAGLFDDSLRSTLVFTAGGLSQPGRAASLPVSTRDVAPTLLALAGLGAEPALGGRSLLPLLADPRAESAGEAVSSAARRAGRIGRSARSERWRFTEWPDGSSELYDHDSDPLEITNLAGRPEQRATIAGLARAFAPSPPSHAGTTGAARGKAPPARPRNVLLVVIDDLNTRVGAWGAPVRTPSIDRLAQRGVRFDRAYVAVAMCSPSRVSMMTGWRPERTGVWSNLDLARPAGALPLQEHFAAHGYVTAAVGKIYHYPELFRWDVREEHPQVVEEEGEGAPEPGGEGLWAAAGGGDADQPDGQRAIRAASLLARYRNRRFFLAVGFVRPHLRWIAPARYFGLYPPDAVRLTTYPPDDLADVPAIAVKTRPQPLPGLPLLGRTPPGLVRDPAFRRQAIAAYEACTTFADAQLGVLLEALDRLDLWRSTLVVLVGDNGFHLGEHDGLLRKDTLFEEGLRVPLIVAGPGVARGGAVARAPVEVSDLYPTVVELAGLPAVGGLDARSLVPLLVDPGAPGRGPAVSFRRVQPPERGWSIRTSRLRYTLWPDGSEELYDERGRGGERENLAGRPERAAEKRALRARLEALVARP
ncbi:MAG: sulfatase-like hydrolase/transferase, partial [Betaproteobacteria bacterium]